MIENQRNFALFDQIMLPIAIKVLIYQWGDNIIVSVKGGMGRLSTCSVFMTLFARNCTPQRDRNIL
jgi:hypothetical protein